MEEEIEKRFKKLTDALNDFLAIFREQASVLTDELNYSANAGTGISRTKIEEGEQKMKEAFCTLDSLASEILSIVDRRKNMLLEHGEHLKQYCPEEAEAIENTR